MISFWSVKFYNKINWSNVAKRSYYCVTCWHITCPLRLPANQNNDMNQWHVHIWHILNLMCYSFTIESNDMKNIKEVWGLKCPQIDEATDTPFPVLFLFPSVFVANIYVWANNQQHRLLLLARARRTWKMKQLPKYFS